MPPRLFSVVDLRVFVCLCVCMTVPVCEHTSLSIDLSLDLFSSLPLNPHVAFTAPFNLLCAFVCHQLIADIDQNFGVVLILEHLLESLVLMKRT